MERTKSYSRVHPVRATEFFCDNPNRIPQDRWWIEARRAPNSLREISILTEGVHPQHLRDSIDQS